jgi:hypothetical protein
MSKGRNRTGTPVYKLSADGEKVVDYSSIHLAMQMERRSYRILMHAIISCTPLEGYYYSLGRKYSKAICISSSPTRQPWESENGIFNVDEWRKVYL